MSPADSEPLWVTRPSLGDEPNQPSLGDVPNQTGAPMRRPKHTMRRPDREVDARDVLDACEVEVDSDEEVDARDDLDAHAVLAVELVEEVVVLLLELGLRCVMYVRLDENVAGREEAPRRCRRRTRGQTRR